MEGTVNISPQNSLHKRAVLLVEPECLVRYAIKQLIDALDMYGVAAEADDMPGALEIIDKTPIDLIVSEMALPGPSGLEFLLELQRRKISKITYW